MTPTQFDVLCGVALHRSASWFEAPERNETTNDLVAWGLIIKIAPHRPDMGADPGSYRFTDKGAALWYPDHELTVQVLFYTGMREGELLGLQWEDIDWRRNLIREVMVAALHNHAPNICVEVGRQNTPAHQRPTYNELEGALRASKQSLAA